MSGRVGSGNPPADPIGPLLPAQGTARLAKLRRNAMSIATGISPDPFKPQRGGMDLPARSDAGAGQRHHCDSLTRKNCWCLPGMKKFVTLN